MGKKAKRCPNCGQFRKAGKPCRRCQRGRTGRGRSGRVSDAPWNKGKKTERCEFVKKNGERCKHLTSKKWCRVHRGRKAVRKHLEGRSGISPGFQSAQAALLERRRCPRCKGFIKSQGKPYCKRCKR